MYNPVAKHAHKYNKSQGILDKKTSYKRKPKHRNKDVNNDNRRDK